jgi:hypothetical protein
MNYYWGYSSYHHGWGSSHLHHNHDRNDFTEADSVSVNQEGNEAFETDMQAS